MKNSLVGLAAVAVLAGGMPSSNFSNQVRSLQTQSGTTQKQSVSQGAQNRTTRRAMQLNAGSGSRGWQRRRGPGWTVRQVQRMATKARNIKRHRAACR